MIREAWLDANISTLLCPDDDGIQVGDLRLKYSDNHRPAGFHTIPAAILKNGSGPTLLLSGGVHGDEAVGPAALSTLLHAIDEKSFQGRIIVLPAVNMPAVSAGTRCSPLDDANLNRSFLPGAADAPTAMIANFIENKILPCCDAVVDLHSGGAGQIYAPLSMVYLGARSVDDASVALAEAFQATYSWASKFDEQTTFNAAAVRANVSMVAVELGGGTGVDRSMVDTAIAGIGRVLVHLGMRDERHSVANSGNSIHVEMRPESFVHADRPGMFVPAVFLHQDIAAHDLIGHLIAIDVPESKPYAVKSPCEGIVVAMTNRAEVQRGCSIAMIAQRRSST